jgi:predicted transposase/invertase (TIGR01784 family)
MAQEYDKIFREVLRDLFPAVARKVLGIPAGHYKPLPGDLQYTAEREADQVWEVTPETGDSFILHCELQSTNDKQMLSRMMLYHAFLHYQHKRPIRQFVLYVGKEALRMEHRLQTDALSYRYGLVDLKSFPYQTFLDSDHSQEVLLAILADFGGEAAGLIAEKILAKLRQSTSGTLELSQRTVQLARLALLRNLSTTVLTAAQHMALDIDITEDALYQLGIQKGEQTGLQKGKEEGEQRGEQKGKEETALNMLREGFAEDVVTRITNLPAERIAQLRQQLEAGK